MAGMKGPMDDALEMRVDEDFRNLPSQHEHVLDGHWAFIMNDLLEAGSIEELHKDDGGIVFFFDFKNFNEIRVIDKEKGL